MGSPSISIIIPARNAAGTIDACLGSVLTHVPEESRDIIVVDNGSSDATVDLARKYPIRLILEPNGFVSRTRNQGARLATSPILAFIDSDCQITPGWYDAILSVFADSTIGVTGSRHVIRDTPTWVERVWQRAHGRQALVDGADVAYIPAGNLATRREAFFAVDGFDERLETGEDPDLCARIQINGWRIVESKAIRCVHLGEPRTLRDVFRRERWHGRGARFRYGSGRLAPITFATVLFALFVIVALAGTVAAASLAAPLALLGWLLPLSIPAVYALRYVGVREPAVLSQLTAIYCAYFVGRATALPVVVRRTMISDHRPSRERAA